MPQIRVLSYFDTERIHPSVLLVRLKPSEWSPPDILYIPLSGPFEPIEDEDLGDLEGVTVLLEDLVVRSSALNQVGIRLAHIASRHGLTEIPQLFVRLQDVEEVLQACPAPDSP